MKKISFLLLTILALASCDDNPETEVITDLEAAEEVAISLAEDIMSISEDLGVVSYNSVQNGSNERKTQILPGCGETTTEEFSRQYEGEFVTLNFEAEYELTLECLINFPVGLTASFSTSSNSENTRFTTSGASDGDATIAIDSENLSNYLLNASFVRMGEFNQLVRNQKTFSSTSTVTISELSVNTAYLAAVFSGQTPTGVLIDSGLASYTVAGTNGDGVSYQYSASITFMGDGTTEITINGNTYTIDLESGEVLSAA